MSGGITVSPAASLLPDRRTGLFVRFDTVAPAARHGSAGCVAGLAFDLSLAGGCRLSLRAERTCRDDHDRLRLTDIAFDVDATCPNLPDGIAGRHEGSGDDLLGASIDLSGVAVAQPEAASSCMRGRFVINLAGRLAGPGAALQLDPTTIVVEGDLPTARTDDGTCPGACPPCGQAACDIGQYCADQMCRAPAHWASCTVDSQCPTQSACTAQGNTRLCVPACTTSATSCPALGRLVGRCVVAAGVGTCALDCSRLPDACPAGSTCVGDSIPRTCSWN